MKRTFFLLKIIVVCFVLFFINISIQGQVAKQNTPYLGWNSYNCYGGNIDEYHTIENLKMFIDRLYPYGYRYFVLDAGWYRHYDLKKNEIWPTDNDKRHLSIDEYGRYVPSKVLFPHGFFPITKLTGQYDIIFGVHMMRGIPREAVEKNLPIKGTKYRARDIANINDTCNWSNLMYGIDMNKPGAQEYYNSVLELLASWNIRFIKYDDIVHKPLEIEAVIKAIQNCGKKIHLSISPGDDIDIKNLNTYNKTSMVRISRDIWDLQEDIDITFERWEYIQNLQNIDFWFDMDMIPFGHIRINYPLSKNKLTSTRGYDRMDYYTSAQKRTFITQRAMAASPIFFGGDIPTSSQFVFDLVTNRDMLECNQNGVVGKIVNRIKTYSEFIDVWMTPRKGSKNEGWIGIFNRKPYTDFIKLNISKLGLSSDHSYSLFSIWDNKILDFQQEILFLIPANDVVFLKYKLLE